MILSGKFWSEDAYSLSQFWNTREGTFVKPIFEGLHHVSDLQLSEGCDEPQSIWNSLQPNAIINCQMAETRHGSFSTLHSSKENKLERKRYWSKGNPRSEQTISFSKKGIHGPKRWRIFKLGNFSKVGIGSFSRQLYSEYNSARFGENWQVFGSFRIG